MFEAEFKPDPAQRAVRGAPLLAGSEPRPAVVRISRSAGLPEPLPDVLGFTVRFPDAHGEGRHQDFPLATSLSAPVAHHLLVPARSFFSLPYSSLLPYRIGPELRLVGALPPRVEAGGGTTFDQLLRVAGRGEGEFQLAVAAPLGRWQPIGAIRLGERIPHREGEAIRFNPWNTGGGIRPAGPLMGLRAGAYRGSQAGWRIDGPSDA